MDLLKGQVGDQEVRQGVSALMLVLAREESVTDNLKQQHEYVHSLIEVGKTNVTDKKIVNESLEMMANVCDHVDAHSGEVLEIVYA